MSRRLKILILVASCAVILTLYAFIDPLNSWMPKCFIYQSTGFLCPGCGSQRMIHALLIGNFHDAWRYNPFIICVAPAILIYLFFEFYRERYPNAYRRLNSLSAIVIIILAIAIWTILRNIL